MENVVFNALNAEDRSAICSYINYYGGDEDSGPSRQVLDLEYVLRFWSVNKQRLFNLFGGNLILEKEVEFAMSEEEIETAVYNFLDVPENAEFVATYKKKVAENLNSFIERISARKLIESGYLSGTTIPDTLEIRGVTFRKGMKLMRVLRKVCNMIGVSEEAYEKFRIAHSMVFNQAKLRGTLCLSIHPLDYMTMSDNEEGWDSCMNWRSNGDYHQGTVEMMNSPCVIVAYLKSNNTQIDFGGHYWNSKKWRELIVVNDDLISEIKPYPYVNNDLIDESLRWVRELFTNDSANPFCDTLEILQNKGEAAYLNSLDKEMHFYLSTHKMYNDIYSKHKCYVNVDTFANISRYDLNISGETECMVCGIEMRYCDSNRVACEDCFNDGSLRCASCGDRVHEDEAYWIEGEGYVCPDCFNEYYFSCAQCGKFFLNRYECFVQLDNGQEGDEREVYAETGNYCECCAEDIATRSKHDANCFIIDIADYPENKYGVFFWRKQDFQAAYDARMLLKDKAEASKED